MQSKHLFDKFSSYSLSILAIVFSVQACNVNKYGAATPDRVVEQYLLALEARDANLMLRLAPEYPDISRKVKAKIVKIGGHKIQNRQITYTKPKPILWNAKIQGSYLDRFGIRQKFDDSIVLVYQSKGELKLYAGRWYLSID